MNECVKQIASGVLYQFCGSIYCEIGKLSQIEFVERINQFMKHNNLDNDTPAIKSWENVITSDIVKKNINDYGISRYSIFKIPYDEQPYMGANYMFTTCRYTYYDRFDVYAVTSSGWTEFGIGSTIQEAINDYVWKTFEFLAIPFDLLYNGDE